MNLFNKLFGHSKAKPKDELDRISDSMDSIDAKLEILEKMLSDKSKSETKYVVTGVKSESYDRNGNLMSNEEVEKMLELSRNQQAERKLEMEERQKKINALKNERVEPTEWLKGFLAVCKKNYENVSYETISTLYFQSMNEQREAEKNKDYKKAYIHAEETFSLLPKFIEGEYKQYKTFQIHTMPAVEFSMKYNSIMGLVGGFKNIRDMVNYIPELRYLYREQLSEYEILLELSKKIRKLVKTNPEILQNTLKKQLPDFEPKLITKSCSWMEKFGLLNREKIKNTFKLTLTY